MQSYFWQKPESLCVGFVWFSGSDRIIFKRLWSSPDFLVEKDNDYCVCQTPCNTTRYGKELSMVKIPSKASAKYLAKKFNKTEQYIGWVLLSSISSLVISFFSFSVGGWLQCSMFWVSIAHLQCNNNEKQWHRKYVICFITPVMEVSEAHSGLFSPQRKHLGLRHLLWSLELRKDRAEESVRNCRTAR